MNPIIFILPQLYMVFAQQANQPTSPIPINLPPPTTQPFTKTTFEISIASPTTLSAELFLPDQPPHSGDFTPLLSLSQTNPPKVPTTTSSGCSPSTPCPPQPFDSIAFYTRADTASITVSITPPKAFVTVYNWRFPGLPSKQLTGTLYLRTSASSPPLCAGFARGEVCRGRGTCPPGESICQCETGWGGRSCGTQLLRAPTITERPIWDGEIAAMRESAVVRVPKDGVAYLWDVDGGESRVEFRARVLRGVVVVDGERESVDGGGGVVGMVVKRAGGNLGTGLAEGTRLPSLYDGEGVGEVVVKSGGLYEMVVVGEGVGRWVMGLVVGGGGEAVVSVNVRRCGGDALDCAFGDDGGVSVGVVVGVCVVGVVLLIVVVVVLLWWCKRRRSSRKSRKSISASGAWTDVDLKMTDDADS